MTLLTMLEVIKQSFPDKMEAQIRMDLNSALALYSQETRLPFQNFDVVESGGVPAIGVTPLQKSKGWYSLPDIVTEIVTVKALDARYNETMIPDYHIEHMGRTFAILNLCNLVFEGMGLPRSINLLRFGCSVSPVELSVDSDVPDYPEAFHQALVDHVLAKYFSYKGVLQQSGWFKANYQNLVQAGKRYFNRNTA